MKGSELQEAIDGAWPALEEALKKATGGKDATDPGKALTELKKLFVQKTLARTSTQSEASGTWEPWATTTGVVRRRRRQYTPNQPSGLVELVSSVLVSSDQLRAVGTNGGPEDGFKTLGIGAVQQQIDYGVEVLLAGLIPAPAQSLDEVVTSARNALPGAKTGPLTLVLHIDTYERLDKDEATAKIVDRELGGGCRIPIRNNSLNDRALVVPAEPDGAVWSTALDLQLGWDPEASDVALVSVLSRLLIKTPAGTPRRHLGTIS